MELNRTYPFIFLFFASVFSFASNNYSPENFTNTPPDSVRNFVASGDLFGTRVFIENRGQFDKSLSNGEKILFVYDHSGEKIYFTATGLVYEFVKQNPLTEEEREAREKGKMISETSAKVYYVNMNWLNANADIEVEKTQKQNHYITYGGSEFNSSTFKKIIYKNVYDHIDIEYSLPDDKAYGIKYTVILHPGANPKDIKIAYTGDVSKIKQLKSGDILIKTPVEDITEYAPNSYYEDKQPVVSGFELNKDLITFNFPENYETTKTLIVDPWVTATTTLTTNNCGYDIDYDNSGNVFVYGGYNPFKIAKFNSSGILQWTFSGVVTTPAWTSGSGWACGMLLDKSTGKTYVSRFSNNTQVIRLDASGNYDNFISSGGTLLSEVGEPDFTCSGDLILFGGAFASGEIISVTTGNVGMTSFFQGTNTNCCQDIVCEAKDGLGNFFVIYGQGAGPNSLSNKIAAVSPSFTNNLWTQPSGFVTFNETGNRLSLPVGPSGSTWFKCLAVNMNYLYYYDGLHLAAYSKATGTLITWTSLPLLNVRQQGGIAVDDCDNLYLGGNGSIVCYNFNGTSFSTLTAIPLNTTLTNQYVYDLQLNKGAGLINVTGSGFAGTYSAIYSNACIPYVTSCVCVQPFLAINTTSTNCANIGTSTVNVGGMPGPYSYVWMPGGQTSSVITGMNPGNYTVSVYSSSCNITTTGITTFTSALPPYVLNVNSTSITCAHLGSATVATTGMPGPFSYTWTPTAQTSSAATGLSPGTYTLSIFSGGCNITFTTTTSFNSLIPLTGTFAYDNSVTCYGASTGTGAVTNLAGGSPTQVFSWFNGSVNYSTASTNSLSAGIWSVNVTDALTGCQINQSFFITQPPPFNLTLSSNTPTSCIGTSIALTGINSGGTPGYTYTWTAGPPANTNTVSELVGGIYIYTLNSTDANTCTTSNTISVNFIANPVISVANTSICPLETGTLSAFGASTYTWNNNISGSIFSDNPITTSQYTVVGSALSCTSSATASIIIKPLPTPLLNSNSPICNGQNLNLFGNGGASYNWAGPLGYYSSLQYPVLNNATPNNSGVYNLTVTAANNCTAAVTKTITVNLTPTLNAAGSTVCVNQILYLFANSFTGSTYFWLGPLSFTSNLQNPFITTPAVNASGTYTVKATSAVGCTNTAVANVTVTAMPIPTITSTSPKCYGSTLNFTGNGGVSYLWNGPNGFSSVIQNPTITGVTLPAAGIYTLQVTTGPCVNKTTHTVTIYALPAFTINSNTPVCETKSLSLVTSAVSNAVSYFWHGPAIFTSTTQVTGRDSCKLNYSGIYTLTVTDNNTCQNTNTYVVAVNQNPSLTPISTTVCLNEPATLNVSGAATYLWSGPNFYYSNQASAFIAQATSPVPTIYTVVGTAANQCASVVTASLSTLSLPLPALTVFPDTRLCLNKNITLQGSGGVAYDWYGPNNIQYAGQSVTISANSFIYNGTYTLMVSDAKGCRASTLTAITIDALPDGSIVGSRMQGCVPFSSDFKFLASNSTSAGRIKSSWVVNSKSYTGQSFTVPFTSPGNYTITGTLTDTLRSCISKVSNVIEVYPLPKADFEFSPEAPIEGQQVLFTNTSTGEEQQKWNWYFKTNKVDSSKKEHPIYSYSESGVYPVALVVKNKWGCADSSIKLIKIDADLTIYIPNAFTPNGDGLNDIFLPILRGIKTYNLMIFNRWGTKLFETNDLNIGWLGVFNDQPCSNDVYTWKISISAINGEMKTLTGSVLLNR